MNQKELKELIEFVIEKDIAEFELERGDVKVRIRRAGAQPPAPQETRFITMTAAAPAAMESPATASSAAPAAQPTSAGGAAEPAGEAGLHTINSPIVGTFYESPSPGSPPFVKPGDLVEAGQVLCIIEAMKLMNEIESDVAGEVVKTFVSNNQPVEYGQPLFAIRPRA
jgi:acetyl-CoA carboxylase biotin carboxyl carrier protein